MARRGRRGLGTVYFSKTDHRWVARYPLGIVDGKRVAKRVKCRTPDEADAELANLRRLYGAGGKPATDTLDAYLAGWLPGHRDIRPSTPRSYQGHIDHHISPLLGGILLRKLAPRDVRLPRIEREPVRPLIAADADAIVAATDRTWLGPLVRLLRGSGLRLGEALGLDQGDLLLEAGFVRVRHSKTSVRAVPVSDDAVEALRDALAAAPRRGPDEPVFFAPRRNRAGHRDRLNGWSVSHALPRVLEEAELGHLAPHALRHGAATLMLADGTPMRVIAEQLGHRNPALTARVYAHVIPEAQRAAVASLERRRGR